jgi:alpha-D-ribose 1-methylphosphonate 5-triphosphate synthase subunit PhnG
MPATLGTDLDIRMTVCDSLQATRRAWLAVLARAARTELEEAGARLAPLAPAQTVRAPEQGMVMLRGRVAGTGDAFNLGEASVTRCAVRVGAALGVGYTLGRDRVKAEWIARFDALLQDEALRPRLLRELVEPLRAAQARRREEEGRAVASSRVEFFTMVRGEM